MHKATGILAGVLAALLGLAPHLIPGARLPLQNLWRADTMPDDMPLALLPVSQYYLWLMISMLVAGGLFAGLAARALARRDHHRIGIALGLFGVQAVAVGQSFSTVGGGLGSSARSTAYLAGTLLAAIVGVALAHMVFWVVVSSSVPVAALGVSLAAAPFEEWVSALLLTGPFHTPQLLGLMDRWLPAVVVGLALAWCGLGTSRLWVWAVALLSLWLVPTAADAVQFVAGSRAILSVPSEIPGAVARSWARDAPGFTPPVLGAAVLGVVAAGLRHMALARSTR